jgi:hypothetical protein
MVSFLSIYTEHSLKWSDMRLHFTVILIEFWSLYVKSIAY